MSRMLLLILLRFCCRNAYGRRPDNRGKVVIMYLTGVCERKSWYFNKTLIMMDWVRNERYVYASRVLHNN